jgi:hypothetical protein
MNALAASGIKGTALIPFGTESFVFQFAIQEHKGSNKKKTIMLPVVLYGCEILSFLFRQ